MPSPRLLLLLASAALSLPALAQPQSTTSSPPAAAAPAEPKTLPVPDAVKALGTVYHALPGRERQVQFTSDAPLERIDGHSSEVIGYAVAGGPDNPAALKAGEWRLPVASLRTGNSMRDQHITEASWLDAAKNPHIVFRLTEVKDAKPAPDAKPDAKGGAKTYTATLVGEMSIHGVTKPMTIEGATVAFLSGTDATAKVADGDLLRITATYTVTLADFGIANPAIAERKKVAKTVDIKTDLVLSTVPPDEQPAAGGKKGA